MTNKVVVKYFADLNNDGALGRSEPAAQTAADGTYALTVTPEILGTRFHVREVPQAGWRPTNPDAEIPRT